MRYLQILCDIYARIGSALKVVNDQASTCFFSFFHNYRDIPDVLVIRPVVSPGNIQPQPGKGTLPAGPNKQHLCLYTFQNPF